MATILFSKKGNFRASVISYFHPDREGMMFKVVETGYTNESEKRCITNARRYLKRLRHNKPVNFKRQRKKPAKPKRIKRRRKY